MSSVEIIRQAELLLKAGDHEGALEFAELLASRAASGKYALPPQLRNLHRVWREEPDYVGEISSFDDLSHGRFGMSTSLTPAMRLGPPSPLWVNSGVKEVSEEESSMVAPPPYVIVHYSVDGLGEYGFVGNLEDLKNGDVVKVWTGPLKLSMPPQVNALRIEKWK